MEVAVLWLTQCGFHDFCFKVHCDNTSVIASYWKGCSRNPSRNDSICRTTSLLAASNILINPCYVPSATNKADGLSHGEVGAPVLHLVPSVTLPKELSDLLDEY